MPEFTNAQYDEFVSFIEQAEKSAPAEWVVCRSQTEAEAFAAWCIENGIDEPEIRIVID